MGETRDWLKFFELAGIPRSASAQYAVTFIDNRISMDMLMDLNKEYLRDMGISKLGDIISILKQAKVVSQKLSADKALSNKIEDETMEPKVIKVVKKPVEAPTKAISVNKKMTMPKAEVTSPPSKAQSQRVVIRSKSPLSTRLGPPPEQKFAGSLKKNANVFERLGHSEKLKAKGLDASHEYRNKSRQKEFDSTDFNSPQDRFTFKNRNSMSNDAQTEVQNGGGIRKRIVLNRNEETFREGTKSSSKFVHSNDNNIESNSTLKRKVSTSSTKTSSHGVFNKSQEAWEKVPVQKRLGNIRPVPAMVSDIDDQYDKPKKVKYVMVQTLKDGSQVRKTLRPDDPLLKKVPISKTSVKVVAPGSFSSRRRSLSPVPNKSPRTIISTKKPYEGFSLNRSLPEQHNYGTSFHQSDTSPVASMNRRSRNFSYEEEGSSYASRKPYHIGTKRKY